MRRKEGGREGVGGTSKMEKEEQEEGGKEGGCMETSRGREKVRQRWK